MMLSAWMMGTLSDPVPPAPDPGGPETISDMWAYYSSSNISGLSDGDRVLSWEDIAGNSDATQATSGSAPIYRASGMSGHPYLEMGGTTFMTQASLFPSTSFTAFVVTRSSPQTGVSLARLFHSNAVGLYWSSFGSTLGTIGITGGTTGGLRDGSGTTSSSGGAHIWSRTSTESPSVFFNGTSIPSTGNGRLGNQNGQIGGQVGGSFIGELYDIVLYTRVLTGPEIETLEEWANWKYGITFV